MVSFIRIQPQERTNICTICQDGFEEHQEAIGHRIAKIEHSFHEACVRDWIIDKRFCPICRERVVQLKGESVAGLKRTAEVISRLFQYGEQRQLHFATTYLNKYLPLLSHRNQGEIRRSIQLKIQSKQNYSFWLQLYLSSGLLDITEFREMRIEAHKESDLLAKRILGYKRMNSSDKNRLSFITAVRVNDLAQARSYGHKVPQKDLDWAHQTLSSRGLKLSDPNPPEVEAP